MKTAIVIALQLLVSLAASAHADTLLERYREFLLRTTDAQPTAVADWEASLLPDGQWPDIDYGNTDLANWKTPQHLQRIREMALLWVGRPSSARAGDNGLWTAINTALDHWLSHRYQSTNWWHNEIGIPQYMRDIIVLLRHDLEPERLEQALEVMAQLEVHEDYLGGNLIWCADLGLHYGALTGDNHLMERCRNLIVKEIRVTDSEGVWPDNSFQQHGRRLQMYQYGKAFLVESLRIAWQCRETPLAFPQTQIDVLADFLLEGWQWMARGIHTVPGTMDRSATRRGELRSPDLRPLLPFAMELMQERAPQLKQLASIQNGEGALSGYRHFPYADFTAYHRPGFSFFLKTLSDRTLPTESINNENRLGKLFHSGDAYLIRNGNEYFDLLPVWDWTALPGVTTFRDAHAVARKPFVGSVDDGYSGFSVMDYALEDETGTQTLTARKLWACEGDAVVCLISGLQGDNINGKLYTALDQSRWQDDVTVDRPGNVLGEGTHLLTDVRWIHHAGFAYIPLDTSAFRLQLEEKTGDWRTINAGEAGGDLRDRVFLPRMRHGKPDGLSTGYVLALAETPKKAAKLASKPSWEILRNDADCQAVAFDSHTLMIAFYSPGEIKTSEWKTVHVDRPCLVLMKDEKLYISDPSHQGKQVEIKVNGLKMTVDTPKYGGVSSHRLK